jgi:hypothetical protein
MKRSFFAPVLAIMLLFGSAATGAVRLSVSFESGMEEAATETSAGDLQRAASPRKNHAQSSRAPRLARATRHGISRAGLGAYALAQVPWSTRTIRGVRCASSIPSRR